jgi:hypothetical protein
LASFADGDCWIRGEFIVQITTISAAWNLGTAMRTHLQVVSIDESTVISDLHLFPAVHCAVESDDVTGQLAPNFAAHFQWLASLHMAFHALTWGTNRGGKPET